jgi:hypothetical protein
VAGRAGSEPADWGLATTGHKLGRCDVAGARCSFVMSGGPQGIHVRTRSSATSAIAATSMGRARTAHGSRSASARPGQPRPPAADPSTARSVGRARTDRGACGTGSPQSVEEAAGLTARPGRGMAAAPACERTRRGAPGTGHGATPGTPPRPRRPTGLTTCVDAAA